MGIKPEPVERKDVEPAPSWYKIVEREAAAAIYNMPELSGTQQELLDGVRREGEVSANGQYRQPVESLARRGLVTYEVHQLRNKNENGYAYRFTVRPAQSSEFSLARFGRLTFECGGSGAPCLRPGFLCGTGLFVHEGVEFLVVRTPKPATKGGESGKQTPLRPGVGACRYSRRAWATQ